MITGSTKLAAIMKKSSPGYDGFDFSMPAGGLSPASAGFSVGTSLRAPAYAAPRSRALRSTEALAFRDGASQPRVAPATRLTPPAAPVSAPAQRPVGPDPVMLANAARQIARQVNFKPVGRGVFSDATKAQRFLDNNPNFRRLALSRLGQ